MKTAFAAFALVALCIVGLFVWQPRAATTQTSHIGHPTVKDSCWQEEPRVRRLHRQEMALSLPPRTL
jgi:hypothetical protein